MTHLVLPEGWAHKRRKRGSRFALIGVAGRVLGHARRLIVRLGEGHPASGLLIEVRSRIPGLAPVPTGQWGPSSPNHAVRGRSKNEPQSFLLSAIVGEG